MLGEELGVLGEGVAALDGLLAVVSRPTPAPWLTESRLLLRIGAAGEDVGLVTLDGLLGLMRFTSPVELFVVELFVSLRFMERMVEPSL